MNPMPRVASEMRRVCRPGGRVIILNHFRSANPIMSWGERLLSPFTVHIGFKCDLDLPGFLTQADLQRYEIGVKVAASFTAMREWGGPLPRMAMVAHPPLFGATVKSFECNPAR